MSEFLFFWVNYSFKT